MLTKSSAIRLVVFPESRLPSLRNGSTGVMTAKRKGRPLAAMRVDGFPPRLPSHGIGGDSEESKKGNEEESTPDGRSRSRSRYVCMCLLAIDQVAFSCSHPALSEDSTPEPKRLFYSPIPASRVRIFDASSLLHLPLNCSD
jgi:hypothetical protein